MKLRTFKAVKLPTAGGLHHASLAMAKLCLTDGRMSCQQLLNEGLRSMPFLKIVADVCSTYFSFCGNAAGGNGDGDLRATICSRWLHPVSSEHHPGFSSWMLYGEHWHNGGASIQSHLQHSDCCRCAFLQPCMPMQLWDIAKASGAGCVQTSCSKSVHVCEKQYACLQKQLGVHAGLDAAGPDAANRVSVLSSCRQVSHPNSDLKSN